MRDIKGDSGLKNNITLATCDLILTRFVCSYHMTFSYSYIFIKIYDNNKEVFNKKYFNKSKLLRK